MKSWGRAAAALVALVATAVPDAHADHGDDPREVVLVKFTVPAGTAGVNVAISAMPAAYAVDPATYGVGIGRRDTGGHVKVLAGEGGGTTVGVLSPHHSMTFDFVGRTPSPGITSSWRVEEPAGSEMAALLFATGMNLHDITASVTTAEGAAVSFSQTVLGGTGVLRWDNQPDDSARPTMVYGGAVHAGASGDVRVRFEDTSIVGGMVEPAYGALAWDSPASVPAEDKAGDDTGFAGPPGEWRFNWSGAVVGVTSASVSLAPLPGDDWRYFLPRS